MSDGSKAGGAQLPNESGFRLGDELRGERATMGKTLLDVQRDLRIKATYISAIEDLDLTVFPNASFVPGYVRSYARYLRLDPDQVLRRFCAESGFVGRQEQGARKPGRAPSSKAAAGAGMGFPVIARPTIGLPALPWRALGSLAVLALLVGGLGYGGWTVLQNIQRVRFAPVDELPVALAEIPPMEAPEPAEPLSPQLAELASPVTSTALAELYRQQDVEVPILAPRDLPIGTLDPDRGRRGTIAATNLVQAGVQAAVMAAANADPDGPAAAELAEGPPGPADAAATEALAAAEAALAPVVVLAERAAWIRVYLASGTILYEKILERGDSYSPPEGVGEALLWAGNSGSVYVQVGEALHGPLGPGTRAAKDVVLTPAAIQARYAAVEVVPETISQVFRTAPPVADPQSELQ